MKTILSTYDAQKLVNKLVFWQAPASRYNSSYFGVDRILGVNSQEKKPLTTESVFGSELAYAFINEYSFEDVENGLLCYSDGDRYVTYITIEDNDLLKIAKEFNMFYIDSNTLEIAKSKLTDQQRQFIKENYNVVLEEIEEKVSFDSWKVVTKITLNEKN